MKAPRSQKPLCALIALLPLWSHASLQDGWQTQGTNTLRLETYNASGDPLTTPYQFEDEQYSNEIALSFQKQVSPFEFWRGQVSGVVNDSDYRSPYHGFVPEVLSLFREKGDAAIPYRLELGDYYGYYSYRTLQRSLKGLQVELQPWAGNRDRNLSLVLTSGAAAYDWRGFQFSDDYTTGISALIEDVRFGRYSANVLHNSRNRQAAFGSLDRDQWVFSLAGEKTFAFLGQRLSLEGEMGWLDGDHDGGFMPASGQNRSGMGAYTQLIGQTRSGINYRTRYERYDEDYRPAGAFVSPDRQLFEGHLGKRFTNGLQVSGRYQNYRDQFASANPQDTDVTGLQLTGPLAPPDWYGLNGSIDIYRQRIEDRSGFFDIELLNLNANVSATLPGGSLALLTLLAQEQDDLSITDNDSTSWETTFSLTRSVALGNWQGSITPGIMVRKVNGGFLDTSSWQPTLSVSLAKGAHLVSGNYGIISQRPGVPGSIDTNTQTAALAYSYTTGKNVFGLEANWFDQKLDPGADSSANRLSMYWTHYLGNADPLAWLPTTTIGGSSGAAAPLVPVGTGASSDADTAHDRPDLSLLKKLAPGASLAEISKRLGDAGLPSPVSIGSTSIYETSLLPTVLQRQRLVIEGRDGLVKRSALIIELDRVGQAVTDRQQLETVREAMIHAYGRPMRNTAEGYLDTSNIIKAVNLGQFIDISEWQIGDNIIRMGIPRRLDGHVRIEIQHSHQFGPPLETRWSIEQVR